MSFLKRKNKKIYLKNSPVTIGIAGIDCKIGTTSFSILTAAYLSEICGYKTAVVMPKVTDGDGVFERISETVSEEKRYEKYYTVNNIDFFYEIDTAFICGTGYDYIVIDYGRLTDFILNDFVRNICKIVVGSCQIWHRKAFEQSLRLLEQIKDNREWIYVVQGTDKDISLLNKTKNIKAVKMPYIENSMKITNISLEFFEKIM